MAEVRPLTKGDVSALLNMWEQLNRAGTAADARYVIRDGSRDAFRALIMEDWLGRFLPFPACFVAEADGEIVGYVQGDVCRQHPLLVEPPKCRIGNLWVQPEHRRLGVGRALVQTYVTAAKEAGFPWVEVGTLAKDARAVAFWQALGFGDWRVSLLRTP